MFGLGLSRVVSFSGRRERTEQPKTAAKEREGKATGTRMEKTRKRRRTEKMETARKTTRRRTTKKRERKKTKERMAWADRISLGFITGRWKRKASEGFEKTIVSASPV